MFKNNQLHKQQSAYTKSGVDTVAGERAVNLIKEHVEKTFRNWDGEVLSGIGGFGAVLEHKDGRVSAYSTDGVGTKLLLAVILEKHGTIGQDLVAMCVNDLAMVGITPSVFLDYMAMHKQEPERTEQVIKGIARSCEVSGSALIGGEMAEMPGMYADGHYDLAGFAVGFAKSKDELITGESIKAGMKIWGYPSSGVHTNGFSLIRKVFGIDHEKPEDARAILNKHYDSFGRTLGDELMEPTNLYPKIVQDLLSKYNIAGLVNITGGGFYENPPRIMPSGLAGSFDVSAWKHQPIFDLIKDEGGLSQEDMLHAFNCGIGFLAVSDDHLPSPFVEIGKIIKNDKKDSQFI